MNKAKKININGTEYELEDEVARSLMTDEFDSTAAYSSGDYCIYDNTLYKFTAAKSAGNWDTSVVEATTVGAELASLNTDLTDSGWIYPTLNDDFADPTSSAGSQLCYRKIGNRVFIRGGFSHGATQISSNTIFTLPSGYRPAQQHYWFATSVGRSIMRLFVNQSGAVVVEWHVNIADGSYITSEIAWCNISTYFFVD